MGSGATGDTDLRDAPRTDDRRVSSPRDREGVFITFEGIEGSGKSTQIRRLADRIRADGREVVLTREPGGTDLGRRLREILLDTAGPSLSPVTELLLYAADRSQHLTDVITPGLRRGAVVLCDRYLDATLAYQGYGRELGCDAILKIHAFAPLDRRPDRTVILDLDPGIGVLRARERNDRTGQARSEGRFDNEAMAFHERVRTGYLLLAEQQVARYRVVDAEGTEDDVHARVWAAVRDLISAGC